jgi:hypothetical protein
MRRVEMDGGRAVVEVPASDRVVVDPHRELLAAPQPTE